MSTINDHWHHGHSPIAAGLYYPDDSCRSAIFDCEHVRLIIGERGPLPADSVFVDLGSYERGRLHCPHGVVRWGGGPREAEGWIALENHDGQLSWLLHIEDSEQFTQARVDCDVIEAVVYEYPIMSTFRIPIEAPHLTLLAPEPDLLSS